MKTTEITINVSKSHAIGWKAESDIILKGQRVLRITTTKGRKGLKSDAISVELMEESPSGFSGFTWNPFGDFRSDLVTVHPEKRATQKSVETAHRRALADRERLQNLVNEACEHYGLSTITLAP